MLFESEQHQEQKQYRSSSKSSSRNSRKMQPKASFSSGFRSYVTHFFSEILLLFRPSVPWCFPVRDVFFDSEQHRAKAVGAAARALAAVAGKCSQMFIFQMFIFKRFQKLRKEFFGAILVLFCPFAPWCFPVREPFFESEQQQEQQPQ